MNVIHRLVRNDAFASEVVTQQSVAPPAQSSEDLWYGSWERLKMALAQSSDLDYQIDCFHAYFGNKKLPNGHYKVNLRRGGSAKPTVFTPAYVTELAASNLTARRIREPFFVRQAELLDELHSMQGGE